MKKKIVRILSLAIALTMILCLNVPAAYAAWNRWQELAHINADNYREMGFSETSGAIVMNGDIWRWSGGQGTLDGSYYYSAQNNATYYMGGTVYSGQVGSNSTKGSTINLGTSSGYIAADGNFVCNNGLTYTDGYYTYFWSNDRGCYFRYTNENGGKQYDGPKTRYPATYNGNTYSGGQTGGNTTTAYSERSANLPGYDYSYKGVKLYAGRLYNVEQYVNKDQAQSLAIFVEGHAGDGNYETKMNAAYMALNYSKNCNFSSQNARAAYPLYNPNGSYSPESYAAACEALFRTAAENSGMTYVGKTLPKGYTYYTIDSDGQIYFKDFAGGAYYTFPEAQSTYKSALHSPY